MLTAPDKERLRFYSPVSFLRSHQEELTALESAALERNFTDGELRSAGGGPRVLYRHLDWDSRHFGLPVYRLEFASCADPFSDRSATALAGVYRTLVAQLAAQHPSFYVFAEAPSEDLLVLHALCIAGFRLIETRLTYYRADVQTLETAERYPTRLATEADIPNLKDVARRARNGFDRYHADPFFSPEVADEYLATYVANSVLGFADMVIVPAPDAAEPGAFLTGAFDRRQDEVCGMNMARIPLTAVAPERTGWNRRLNSELMHWFKDRGTKMIYTTTQSTNRAAIHVLESLHYSFGRSTHLLAIGISG